MNIWSTFLASTITCLVSIAACVAAINQFIKLLESVAKLAEFLKRRSQAAVVTSQTMSNAEDATSLPKLPKLGLWLALPVAALGAAVFASGTALSTWGLAAALVCAASIPVLVLSPYLIFMSRSLVFITSMADRHAAVTEELIATLTEKEVKAQKGLL